MEKTERGNAAVVPIHQLTRQLVHTYNQINANYYRKRNLAQNGLFPKKKKQPVTKDDKVSDDYEIVDGEEIFNGRYQVRGRRLGKGSFGQVVEAMDRTNGQHVAIKIVKKKKTFMAQAQTEIGLLETLHNSDHPGKKFIVQLKDAFVHKGHQCLVFERLDVNLYELLRKTKYKGIGLRLLSKLTRQILQGLEYLALPNVNIIHCDLKPENILLVHSARSQLKIIDFGSSCMTQKQVYQYIQSRFYRAPEVLLGMPYTPAIDMWSLGCILVEMHTGKPLFGGCDQYDQLRRITNVLGMLPKELIERANPKFRRDYFEEIVVVEGESRLINYRLKVRKSNSSNMAGNQHTDGPTTLSDIIGVETGGPEGRRLNQSDHSIEYYQLFLDLVQRMLDYNPTTRITPTDALAHPFIEMLRHSSDAKEKKKVKCMRTTQMRDVYSVQAPDAQGDFGEFNRIKQRRLYENTDAGH